MINLCKNCLGCNMLEIKDFIGTNKCSNYVEYVNNNKNNGYIKNTSRINFKQGKISDIKNITKDI